MEALTEVKFASCRLDLCRFEGAAVDKLRLSYVTWGKRPTAFHMSHRDAVRDEDPGYERLSFVDEDGVLRPGGAVSTPVSKDQAHMAYKSLKNLYGGLRRKAEKDGEFAQAQDFYFGELEMDYHSRPRPRRWISWEFFYRYLSGFGKQDGLAAAWLALIIFLIFPVLYYWLERHGYYAVETRWQTAVDALAHSCQASALLTAKGKDLGPWGDLLSSLERMLVPIQAGLLILAIRYNFQHQVGE